MKICTAYELDGKEITEYPANLDQLKRCKPIFEELPGWTEDVTSVRTLEELPENARKYLERISELCNVQISIFSVGPDREQTNLLKIVVELYISHCNDYKYMSLLSFIGRRLLLSCFCIDSII